MPRRVVRVSGVPEQTLRAGVAAVATELEVADGFPARVLQEAEEAARAPRLPTLDRTDLPFVTIDPVGARDLDQAIHLERRGSGYRVHYAIADVAAFVTPGGAVDAEAHRRGETLYGPGTKVPLHPPVLSEQAASLLPDGPRPALLWTLDLDADGDCREGRVERALVRSRAHLSYDEVQRHLDAGTATEGMLLLAEVGRLRLAQERARGGVSLPLPDQEVELVDGHWQLAFRQPLPVEAWNAQISLLTGMAAARLMVEGGVGILRTLAPAEEDGLRRLRRIARALHVPWPESQPYPELIRSLDAGRADHAAMLTASTSLLRGSGYAAFDGAVPERANHSAIAAPYAHVTAPLRRLVDRYAGEVCLALSAGRAVPDWARSRLEDLPAEMQASAHRASRFERAVLDLVEATALREHVGEEFDAMVVEVDRKDRRQGEVVLRAPAVEASVESASDLPLGSDVRVRLVEADPATRRVRFALV